MARRRQVVGALAVAATLAAAGCTSSTGAPATTATTSPVGRTTTPTTGGSSARAVANAAISSAVRAQLVATVASLNNIPPSEYSGLAPRLTYYAFDPATHTYWAGARLVPAPAPDPSSPTQAQISSQDAGSYYVFQRPQGGSWTAFAAGNTGPGTACPVVVPPTVLRVWGWPSGSCRPSGA